jgi:hypothetical protein
MNMFGLIFRRRGLLSKVIGAVRLIVTGSTITQLREARPRTFRNRDMNGMSFPVRRCTPTCTARNGAVNVSGQARQGGRSPRHPKDESVAVGGTQRSAWHALHQTTPRARLLSSRGAVAYGHSAHRALAFCGGCRNPLNHTSSIVRSNSGSRNSRTIPPLPLRLSCIVYRRPAQLRTRMRLH